MLSISSIDYQKYFPTSFNVHCEASNLFQHRGNYTLWWDDTVCRKQKICKSVWGTINHMSYWVDSSIASAAYHLTGGCVLYTIGWSVSPTIYFHVTPIRLSFEAICYKILMLMITADHLMLITCLSETKRQESCWRIPGPMSLQYQLEYKPMPSSNVLKNATQ